MTGYSCGVSTSGSSGDAGGGRGGGGGGGGSSDGDGCGSGVFTEAEVTRPVPAFLPGPARFGANRVSCVVL